VLSGFLLQHHLMKTNGEEGEGVQFRGLFSSAPYSGQHCNRLVATSPGKERKFTLDRKLNEPWSRSAPSDEQTKVFILLGFETQPSNLGSSLHGPR
jgi:hypothetical protein